MKLQKLTIHNIASIKDAVIDFDAPPLSDSEVFLISGKTGAGKSTILDAICLALYGTTPRFENTNMQGESTDGDKDVKINDPRQLMRRNTGEAYVELTFTGSNGILYEARWSVARARNKPSGNLQAKKWQLKNIGNDVVLTKDKEIADEIRAAVGLEFGQFCRTTMLAQGEFTRFLNSKDKEKAEILEKITGVDIYSKIGKKIFELTALRQRAWEDAARQVANIKVLTQEEITQLNTAIANCEEQETQMNASRKVIDAKLTWLNAEIDLSKKISEAEAEYNVALEKTQNEEFGREQKLTKYWNDTIEAREYNRRLISSLKASADLRKTFEDAKADFSELMGSLTMMQTEIRHTDKELEDTNLCILAESERAQVYKQTQTVTGYLETILSGRRKIAEENKNLVSEEDNLNNKLIPQKAKADSDLKEEQRKLKEIEIRLKELEQTLEAMNLADLRKKKDELLTFRTEITDAKHKLATLTKETERHNHRIQALSDQRKAIESMKVELTAMQKPVEDAQTRVMAYKELMDKQRESVDKWAKAMRTRLHKGDFCPVCGQKIEKAFIPEYELEKLFLQTVEAYNDANKEWDKLKDEERNKQAEVKSFTDALKKGIDDLNADRTVHICTDAAIEACTKCGITEIDDQTYTLVETCIAKCQKGLEDLNEKIISAEVIEKAVTESRRATDAQRKKTEQAGKRYETADNSVADSNSRIVTIQRLISSKKDEVSATEQKMACILVGTKWNHDPVTETELFRDELVEASKAYNDKVDKLGNLQNKLKELQVLQGQVKTPLDAIIILMPDWADIKPCYTTPMENPSTKANNLRTMIHSAKDQLKKIQDTYNEAQAYLDRYMIVNDNMSHALLSELDTYTAADISVINGKLTSLHEKVVASKSVVDRLRHDLTTHLSKKPVLADDEGIESLQASIMQIDKHMAEIRDKKAGIQMQLRQDADNKREQRNKLDDAESKKKAYGQWSRINQLIGDATGNKFRKIAQSYVLSSLIRTANSYMKTLTDRYTLTVVPGTFVIMLEDAYQGYASRAASTISGGETFLVSLALALALSDIGSTLQVDTLFIDEGFGTLSGEPLQKAVETLRSLHTRAGRHVGIISHVEELRERIPVQIQVNQEGNNSSSSISVV